MSEDEEPRHVKKSWHHLETSEALTALDAPLRGLDESEAAQRAARVGPNRLPDIRSRSLPIRFLQQLNDRFIYILVIAAILTGVLQLWLDTAVILSVILLTALAGLMQEGRARKALNTMNNMMSPNARVVREGRHLDIPAEQLVPGDIVLLQSGDQVPADMRLLSTDGLQIDEAILIGESSPTLKGSVALEVDTPLTDRINMAYAGTLVMAGHGRALVVATGADTELGNINTLLEDPEPYTTPLSRQLKWLINGVSIVLLSAAALVLGFGLLTPGMEGHTPAGLIQATASLAVAAVPEGLPALFAIILGISVQRLASRHVMVRNPSAIEDLGAVSVICTDKNTLTRHELTVQKVFTARGGLMVQGTGYAPQGKVTRDDFSDPDTDDRADIRALAQAAVLASDASLSCDGDNWQAQGDPLEAALLAMAHKFGVEPDKVRNAFTRQASIPFNRTYRYMATLSNAADQSQQLVIKGAPEAVLPRCSHVLTDAGSGFIEQAAWEEKVRKLASQGMQILVVASKPLEKPLSSLSHEDVGYGLTLLGVIGFTDPPRDDVPEGVKRCQQAGIRMKMLTGDHALTACTLGYKVGIGDGETVITGTQLDEMDDVALQGALAKVDVFARVTPEQKLRLVSAMQQRGERVAMVGSGVNDTPAMKQAEVGVALGVRSTEAARQSAELVLARDELPALADAVSEGRTSYLNFQKIVQFMIPGNGAQAITIILAVLFGLALPLMPLQVLWVNLVIAGLLGITLAFERAEPAIMQRAAPTMTPSLFSGFLLWRLLLVSGILLVSVLGIFIWEINRGETLEAARTAAVNTLVFGQMFYLLSVRHSTMPGWRWSNLTANRWILPAIGVVLTLQLLFTYWTPLSGIVGAAAIDVYAWLWVLAAGSLVFLVVELEKAVQRNAEGWLQSVTRQVLRHFDPRFWKEKGLRWTVQFFAAIFLVSQLMLMFLWSREPTTFDVEENARQMVNAEPGERLKPGVITTATLTRIADTMLEKSGGYTSNDRLPPGVIMEHLLVMPDMPNWEFGVLTQVRDMSLAMRDDLSRSQSQSAADPDLVKAQIRFNTDSNLWLFPPAETQFNEGVEALEAYLQRLHTDQAQFYARADNLNNWLTKVQRQMGTLSIALSASVGIRQVREEGAAMSITDGAIQAPGVEVEAEVITAEDDPSEVIVKTPRLRVDDVFYQARGQTWAILHLLKAIETDFEPVLRQKNALVSLRQIINKLEDTQEDIWSPIILNGSGYSFVANHSLVMASQISRANAALIDLGTLLREG